MDSVSVLACKRKGAFIFALAYLSVLSGAYAEDISNDITQSATYGDGAEVNIVENVTATEASISVDGGGAEVAPVLSIARGKTLSLSDGASLSISQGVLSFATEATLSSGAGATLSVAGSSPDSASTAYIKESILRLYASYVNSGPKFLGSGYGSITLDATTVEQPSTNWFSLAWDFKDNSTFNMTNGASIDYSKLNLDRGGSTMSFSGSSEFNMDKASTIFLYQYMGGLNLNFSENSSLNLDGDGTSFMLQGSHGGLNSCVMNLNVSGDASVNLSNSAVLSSQNGTLYATLSDNASLNISSGASLSKVNSYAYLEASGNSSINLSDGASISGFSGISLSENSSFNVSNLAFSATAIMTLADSAAINIKDGASYVIENNASSLIGLAGSESENISLNISGSSEEGVDSMLHLKSGTLDVTDGGSVNITDGANIYFESDKTSTISVGGETPDNAGKFVMTGGTISQKDGGANNMARTFDLSGYGTLTLDAVTVEDLWRYTLHTSGNSVLTLKNGTTWASSSRVRDIQIGGNSTFNIETGSVFNYNYYGGAGMDSFKIFENGVVNVVGEGSGIKTNSGSPTITLAGNGVMNIKDGAYLGNYTDGGVRQYYVSISENSALNLSNGGIMRMSAWNGNTNIVNVSGSGSINIDAGTLNAASYVNKTGYFNFSGSSSLNVKNGGKIISDSASATRHSAWIFSDNASIVIEGSGNSVTMGSLNASDTTKISFVADSEGISTLQLLAPAAADQVESGSDAVYLSSISSIISIDFSNLYIEPESILEFFIISSEHEWDMSKYISSSESGSEYVEIIKKNAADTWYIDQFGNTLYISYTAAVPEPAAVAAIFGAMGLLLALLRRRSS